MSAERRRAPRTPMGSAHADGSPRSTGVKTVASDGRGAQGWETRPSRAGKPTSDQTKACVVAHLFSTCYARCGEKARVAFLVDPTLGSNTESDALTPERSAWLFQSCRYGNQILVLRDLVGIAQSLYLPHSLTQMKVFLKVSFYTDLRNINDLGG